MAGQKTLLQIVQRVLSSMDSDDVNSISDTEEAAQVALIAEEVFEDWSTRSDWPHKKDLFSLNSLSDTDRPTHLGIPDDLMNVEFLKYNVTTSTDTKTIWRELKYLEPHAFLDMSLSLPSSETEVESSLTNNGAAILIYNDRMPQYYTSFDEDTIICDAYDSTEENTLQGNKTHVFGAKLTSFTQSDSFVPDVPTELFPGYIAEVKARSHIYYKQQQSPKDEMASRRAINKMQRLGSKTDDNRKNPNYGRRR